MSRGVSGGLLSPGWREPLGSSGEYRTRFTAGVRKGREGAQLGPRAEWPRVPVLLLLVFLRLIREQLLEGDFTVNMRLLQVMQLGSGAGSVLAMRQTLAKHSPRASCCDELQSGAVEDSRAYKSRPLRQTWVWIWVWILALPLTLMVAEP